MENPIKSTFFEYVENIAELDKKRKQNAKLPILICKASVPQYL